MREEALVPMQQALSFVETPEGLTSCTGGALSFGAVCAAVSALVSLRVDQARELEGSANAKQSQFGDCPNA